MTSSDPVVGEPEPDYSGHGTRQEMRKQIVELLAQNKTLNDYADQSHMDNMLWWLDLETGEAISRNRGELMMLMVSEIAEAMEGVRKGLMDDKLPHRTMEEVELADCLIRIFDYAGAYGLDLEGAYQEKRAYNARREDHTHEHRRAEGGKRF